MFRVNSQFQYINHFVSTKEIADIVKDDLSSRECCIYPELVEIIDCGDECASWDPGGSLWLNDELHHFNLPNITVVVFKQHLSYFVDAVNATTERNWSGIKYYKVHSGYMSCLCLTPEDFDSLKDQVNDKETLIEAGMMYEYKLDIMDASGIDLARKQKLDDGRVIVSKLKRNKPSIH